MRLTLKERQSLTRVTCPLFFYAEGYRKTGQIVECTGCGLVYINPREKNIENMYENLESDVYSKSKDERIETFKKDLEKIEKIVLKKGKLLDIGCASRFFLQVAKKKDGMSVE